MSGVGREMALDRASALHVEPVVDVGVQVGLLDPAASCPLLRTHTPLLGAALLQRNADAEAAREFTEAASDIEQLAAPADDTDRARLAVTARRIVQFYNATGRRREGAEWKRKLDTLAKP